MRLMPHFLAWVLRDRSVPLLLMGWFAELAWLAWFLRIVCRSPVMVLSETTPQSFANLPKPPWRVRLLRWLLQRSQSVLFISQRNRLFYEQMGVASDRLFFAPYSIDNDRFLAEIERMRPQQRDLRQFYSLDPDLPVFLFCGKLIPKKRPLELLEAYLQAGLKEKAQLVYVGEGRLRSEIEHRAAEAEAKHVHLLGFFNQSQMPLAYLLGDLFCLLSGPDETFGLVVNEALVGGLPVIVSDAVGCGPNLIGRENGWVLPLDDMKQLIETLREAYNQRDTWSRMGIAGKQRVAIHNFTTMATGVHQALEFISLKQLTIR
jgi:glycosyltransferase involved in cell wall biosynthesis